MKLVVTMGLLPKIYFSGAENRFSACTAVRDIFGVIFQQNDIFFFSAVLFSQERYFFFLPHFTYTETHTRTQTHTHTQRLTHTHTLAHTHTHTQRHTHTRT